MDILFYMLGAAALASGLVAVTRLSPLSSALWLVLCFLALAGLFGLLAAPLIAAMQVLVAAGAVMVLILFVVMLVDVRREIARARLVRFGKILGATGAAYLALVMIIAAAAPPFAAAPDSGGYYSSASTLGLFVIKRYAAAFEIAGLMLLVACVAVIAIAGKDRARPEDTHAPEEKDLEEVAAL